MAGLVLGWVRLSKYIGMIKLRVGSGPPITMKSLSDRSDLKNLYHKWRFELDWAIIFWPDEFSVRPDPIFWESSMARAKLTRPAHLSALIKYS